MKRFILVGLVLFGIGATSYAQKGNKVRDDIYYTAKDAERDAERQRQIDEEYQKQKAQQEAQRRENEKNNSYTDEYDSDGAVIDYDDDDYYYSDRLSRFGYGSFYNPYWSYNPWYNPYWGWGYSPGWSVGVGYRGPYWSSYWGWSNWYGYPAYYSCWNYPYYGYGWGGYGYGGYGYGGYGNGYWDGYYSGIYTNNNNGRQSTYGPRNSMNSYYGGPRSSSGLRTTNSSTIPSTNGSNPRETLREANSGNRYNSATTSPANEVRRGETFSSGDRPGYANPRDNNNVTATPNRSDNYSRPAEDNRTYGGRNENRVRSSETQQQQTYRQPEQRTYEQPQQRTYEQPSYQRSEPSYSAPSRSYDNGGSRSSGGNSGGNSGGRSFGGGRR